MTVINAIRDDIHACQSTNRAKVSEHALIAAKNTYPEKNSFRLQGT
jgi:hypothetical protein